MEVLCIISLCSDVWLFISAVYSAKQATWLIRKNAKTSNLPPINLQLVNGSMGGHTISHPIELSANPKLHRPQAFNRYPICLHHTSGPHPSDTCDGQRMRSPQFSSASYWALWDLLLSLPSRLFDGI
ncbi:uncharacterized protein PADG_07374 [Paracoccidioides brasiliensis Pb18]|uniref:Uncharacterized protein n=1 Tax=Paracoccidioides brasiliensis (strain Pb18) TaxID=502780 RepID=C1GJD8_PARBD|nr:uncharacterized protein PADG_07374 [Paracoccidioides brasiliensis Pb18]EEH42555.1 hypothetical protein PADG_07374 [Paracoccidioides brasiliensis Pb18]